MSQFENLITQPEGQLQFDYAKFQKPNFRSSTYTRLHADSRKGECSISQEFIRLPTTTARCWVARPGSRMGIRYSTQMLTENLEANSSFSLPCCFPSTVFFLVPFATFITPEFEIAHPTSPFLLNIICTLLLTVLIFLAIASACRYEE